MTDEINFHDEETRELSDTNQVTNTRREIEQEDIGKPADIVSSKKLTFLGNGSFDDLHSRWNTIQAQFVDQPRSSIEQADNLIAEVLQKISQHLTDEHHNLRNRWQDHDDASTEDLRLTLQDYRSFFKSLLNE